MSPLVMLKDKKFRDELSRPSLNFLMFGQVLSFFDDIGNSA